MEQGKNNTQDSSKVLKDAERQIQEDYHRDVARRMGKMAAREIIDHGGSGSLIDDFFAETFTPDSETNTLDAEKQESERTLVTERAIAVMQEEIRRNFMDACRESRTLRDQQKGYEIVYNKALKKSDNGIFSRNSATDRIAQAIPRIDDEIQDLAQSSPEAYTAVHGTELRENIKNRDSGWMIETPYVREHLQRLFDNMSKGRPTFIHGHLGSGKTELAITAAKEFMIDKKAREEAEHCKSDPDLKTPDEKAERIGKVYQKTFDLLKSELVSGNNDVAEQISPLVVSGSGDMETSDLYLDKNLKLAKYNGTDTAGHKDQYDEEFNRWKSGYQKNYEGLSEEEKAQREAKDNDEFFKLYVTEHQAYGTEVELVTEPLLQAIEEGRPFILDEVNAVPNTVLISLNDILQRRPGDTCYVPGKGQVKIKDGFSIIMTGNLSTGNVDYSGTNELNPAFLSRPDVFEYSYLPQNESGKLDEQADMSKNQLFQVMTTYLTDRQGNLELPEIKNTISKLFSLAQFASQTQQIFAGKNIESATYAGQSGDEIDVKFTKSVLSVRNILKVIETWNKGEKMDLDKALWDGFISGVTDAYEQQAFLKLAQNFGFFDTKDGWQIDKMRPGALVNFDDIYPGEYSYLKLPLETYTMTDTVNLIYGKRPERSLYPEFTMEDLEDEIDDDFGEPSVEEYGELEAQGTEFKDAAAALEILSEQCGCSKDDE